MSEPAGRMKTGHLALVAHDAGGAEIVTSLVRRMGREGSACVRGPAVDILARKLPSWSNEDLDSVLASCDWVLSATSWQSDHELFARRIARRRGKPVVAFLDHWTCFRERFVRDGVEERPDEIWVADEYAERLARQELPGTDVFRVGNPYLADVSDQLVELQGGSGVQRPRGVLYVCEPLAEQALMQYGDERYWGYTEFDALGFFLARRDILGLDEVPVLLRPHPAEAPGKYDQLVAENRGDMAVGGTESLLTEVLRCQAVVGCESMAMVIALLAGKRVISCIPPGGKPCSLPHEDIEHLRDIA